MVIKLGAVLLIACTSFAFTDEKLEIHGYFSQTYVKTSDNDNFVEDSTKGSFKWTDFSINFYKSYSDFDFAAQINTRSVGDGGFKTTLDWGYGSYSFNEAVGIRVGKVRTAAVGKHNEYRDVDAARTSILLPQSIYEEGTRDLILGVQGLSLFGSRGPFSYLVSYGTFDVPDDFRLNKDILNTLNANSMDIDIEHDFSALINYEAPIEGLSFSYTYHFAKVDAVANDAPFGALTGDLQIDLEITQHTAGFEYFYLDWTLSGEHTWHQNEMGWNAANGTTLQAYANLLNGLGTGNDDKRRWYLLLSRQITDKLSAELGYSHLITNRNLKSMPSNYRRTYSIASRYDINENFLVKLQFDYNSGYADTISASESIVNGLIPGQKWNTILLRATFQF